MEASPIKPWPSGRGPAQEYCGEPERLEVLSTYGIDDLAGDRELDDITEFAAKLCDTPIALVSVVKENEQRFIGRTGLEAEATPRSMSFCAYAMHGRVPMIVRDAREDPTFCDNPLVTGDPNIRFYAGMPLISREGAPLGSLCVIDSKQRPGGLDEVQQQGLAVLARSVMRRLESRRELRGMVSDVRRGEERLRNLADSIPDIVFVASPEGDFQYFNERWTQVTGLAQDEYSLAELRNAFHPDDEDAWHGQWQAALKSGENYEAEYRLRHSDGSYRWGLARAQPSRREDGSIEHWFGTVTDIDRGHRRSESNKLLAQELAHRIKNIFAVIGSLVSLRSRGTPEIETFGSELSATIRALGRAQDFVRPIAGEESDDLVGLIKVLMAPYDDGAGDRIAVTGEHVPVGSKAVTPIALVFHELATNSAKYGALSSDAGRIEIAISRSGAEQGAADRVHIAWHESGGPAVEPPAREGFGSRLMRTATRNQLGGDITFDWREEGLAVVIEMPGSQVAA